MSKESEYETHPSYGMAVFHRVTGNPGRLFGSPLTEHHSTIRLQIGRGSVKHHLGRDWYHRESTRDFIEVEFSAAQFAALLTTMNCGEGVPCTIRHLGEVSKERSGTQPKVPEDAPLEHEKISESFKQDLADLVKELRQAKKEVAEMLASGKSIKVADKDRINGIMNRVSMEVESNAPFMLEQFQEAAEKVVTASKAEVDATIALAVTNLGLQKLAEITEAGQAKQIGPSDRKSWNP